MREIHAVTLAALLGLGIALPVTARPLTILGSLTITGDNNAPLQNNSITGFAVIASPGLEKTMVQQLPPYTIPVFIDGEEADDDSARSRPNDDHPGNGPNGDDPPGLRPDGPPSNRPDERPRFRLVRRHLDTTLVLTNTTAASLTIELTLKNAAGDVLTGPTDMTFDAHETKLIQVSDLLP